MNKATLTIVIAVVVGAVNSLAPFLSPDLAVLLTAVAGALAVYFHVDAVKQAGLGKK